MTMTEIWLILGMVAVTFSVRYIPLVLVGRLPLPDGLLRALRFVPVAVLTAIIVPVAVMPEGEVALGISNAYFYAGLIAVGIAWRTRNLLTTILGGMIVFLTWRALFP